MRKKAVITLVAAAALGGSGVAGQAALGLGTANAQGVSGWSFVGPAPLQLSDRNLGDGSGRITSVAVVPNRPRQVYIGSAGGGVWKSDDSGEHWKPLTDNLLPGLATGSSMAIGALWVGRTGQRIYAGTGELNGSDSQYGQGVLRSNDGGRSWTVTGRGVFGEHFVGGVAANRNAPNTVLVASDRGLYKSDNGGRSWRRINQLAARIRAVVGGRVSGQVYEIHQDPTNARKYWASFGDRCATEPGGIAVSDNGGSTWKVVFFSLRAGRIGLGVGSTGVAYAAVANCRGALLSIQKTTNGGKTWRAIPKHTPGYNNYFSPQAKDEDPNAQGDYDNVVGVDPANPDRAVFGGINILATRNGGKRFVNIGRVYARGFIHPDFHAIAFNGRSAFYAGQDGGLSHTNNLGGTGSGRDWTNLNGSDDGQGLRNAQFNAGVSLSPTNLLGGTQDNGSPAATPGVAPGLPAMSDIASGDGGYTAIDPGSSQTLYTEYFDLNIFRWTGSGAPRVGTDIAPCPLPPDGDCRDPRLFYAPFVMDLSSPERLLAGTNRVYETLNARGDRGPVTWSRISGPLTRTPRGALSSIALSPAGGRTIFTASSDGEVARTTDGANWTDITGDLPKPGQATNPAVKPFFTQVSFNPANPSQAWVTIGHLGVGQLWYTSNAGVPTGTHWVNLSGTGTTALPPAPAMSVVQDPNRAGTIDVATYYGVWTCSTCGGQSPRAQWQRLGGSNLTNGALPKVEVDSLSLTADNKTLIAWTHGRGIWKFSLGG